MTRRCSAARIGCSGGGGCESVTLRRDAGHQRVPGGDEGLCAFGLKIGGERAHVDSGPAEPGEYLLGVASVGGRRATSPWLAKASSVASGMVLIVCGAARDVTYEEEAARQ
jgi:hypothetical protein